MHPQIPEFEPLRGVLEAADEPLTAREVLRRLKQPGDSRQSRDGCRTHRHSEPRGDDDTFETAHRVATVLGRAADADGPVEVTRGSPYTYRLRD
ncbi:hypothetical protein GL213_03925 [Halogeometricum borinquense]|uniref:Uncharacterized protein n=2 Tax=Halogeometricum borinquense TaxID=60847 RepID=E4NNN0_HALBP|nr:hypothetical protein [Halogeometricum borinquense]ADQ66384.1 hypothetical protein Hbor_07870 [Halogeometricum borinquense DSM 11551]ELY31104.1 hypothetical protein C499_01470 [Halogeometricum borinquense DSM 11551]QIB75748.1 hypothetical protein G3I44_16555 [Halogeometricum borinquense]QIQ75745.1 hypothetical protein GL213_03925 [Halogeometricum borinquense]RYJ15214.1 hypothetical protein ELS19_15510 [Halogeometricum borinquense]